MRKHSKDNCLLEEKMKPGDSIFPKQKLGDSTFLNQKPGDSSLLKQKPGDSTPPPETNLNKVLLPPWPSTRWLDGAGGHSPDTHRMGLWGLILSTLAPWG